MSAVVFCQSGSSYIWNFVLSGAVRSFESLGPITGTLKLNDPTGSSSEREVLARSVTFAVRSSISVPEWFTTTNLATGLLSSVIIRNPTTSTYFWRGLATFWWAAFAGFAEAAASAVLPPGVRRKK